MRRRVDDVGDEAGRDHAIDEHRRRLTGAHRVDDAIDAAARVRPAKQALDAQHVVPAARRRPSIRRSASTAHRRFAVRDDRSRCRAPRPCRKTRSRCCSASTARRARPRPAPACRTTNALTSSAVSCSILGVIDVVVARAIDDRRRRERGASPRAPRGAGSDRRVARVHAVTSCSAARCADHRLPELAGRADDQHFHRRIALLHGARVSRSTSRRRMVSRLS